MAVRLHLSRIGTIVYSLCNDKIKSDHFAFASCTNSAPRYRGQPCWPSGSYVPEGMGHSVLGWQLGPERRCGGVQTAPVRSPACCDAGRGIWCGHRQNMDERSEMPRLGDPTQPLLSQGVGEYTCWRPMFWLNRCIGGVHATEFRWKRYKGVKLGDISKKSFRNLLAFCIKET